MNLSTWGAGLFCTLLVWSSAVFAAPSLGLHNPHQSTPTTLYFHLNGFQDSPINTQIPDAAYSEDVGSFVTASTATCVPENPAGFTHAKYHTYYGFSSPSLVEYNFTDDGKPRIHQNRGTVFETALDTNATFFVHWFLSTQSGSPTTNPDSNALPVIVPQVVVRATMRAGERISVGDEGYNAGEILAQGFSPVAVLGGSEQTTSGAAYSQVAGQNVYELVLPMKFAGSAVVPWNEGFSMRIDVYEKVASGVCDNADTGTFMPNLVRVHTSANHRPRMELGVMDPLRIEYLHPQFDDGNLTVQVMSNSPWGAYDVQTANGTIGFHITGPSGPVHGAYVAPLGRQYHGHGAPVIATIVWPFQASDAPDGLYDVNVTIRNLQSTATATAQGQFHIGEDLYVTVCGQSNSYGVQHVTPNCTVEHQDSAGHVVEASLQSPSIQLLATVVAVTGIAFGKRRKESLE